MCAVRLSLDPLLSEGEYDFLQVTLSMTLSHEATHPLFSNHNKASCTWLPTFKFLQPLKLTLERQTFSKNIFSNQSTTDFLNREKRTSQLHQTHLLFFASFAFSKQWHHTGRCRLPHCPPLSCFLLTAWSLANREPTSF